METGAPTNQTNKNSYKPNFLLFNRRERAQLIAAQTLFKGWSCLKKYWLVCMNKECQTAEQTIYPVLKFQQWICFSILMIATTDNLALNGLYRNWQICLGFWCYYKYLKGLKGFWQIYQLSFYLNFCNVSPVLINDNTL